MKAHAFVGSGCFSLDDGPRVPVVVDRTGALLAVQTHGLFTEAGLYSRSFAASTAVAGVAPGTSLGAGTIPFYLHNPIGSGIVLVVNRVSCGYISGTLGAGTVFLVTVPPPQATLPTGTAIVARCSLIGGNAIPGALPLTSASGASTPVAIRPVFNLGAKAAATAKGPEPTQQRAQVQDIVVAPGYGVGLFAVAAAGTSPKVIFSMQWEEISLSISSGVL